MLYRHVSLQDLFPSYSSADHQAANGTGDGRRSRPIGGLKEGSGAEPGQDAVDPVVRIPRGNHPALETGVHEADDADPVTDAAAILATGVQDPVDPDLERVAGLGGAKGAAEAEGGSRDGAGEVANSCVVGEILAPGTALGEGLLLEEKLRRGREVVEGSVRDLEVLVGVVESPVTGILAVVNVISTVYSWIRHRNSSFRL
ncbi:unnamed protein product [Musa banksii]